MRAAAHDGDSLKTGFIGGSGLKQPIVWQDGYIIPSDRPGLGYELDEAVADAHPYEGDDVFPHMEETPTPTV